MDLLDIRIPDDPFLEPVAIIFVLASRLAVFERVLDFTNDPVQYFHGLFSLCSVRKNWKINRDRFYRLL